MLPLGCANQRAGDHADQRIATQRERRHICELHVSQSIAQLRLPEGGVPDTGSRAATRWSACCRHGSAGLVNLPLSDGSALVSAKRVTGYPDAYEDMSAAYYKTFPFSIGQCLRRSKGQLSLGARGTSHVEADGRLITGMNWESTPGVVAAIVEQLEARSGRGLGPLVE